MEFFLSLHFEGKFLPGVYKWPLFSVLVKDKLLTFDIPIIRFQLHVSSCVPLGKLYHLRLSFHTYQMEITIKHDSERVVRSEFDSIFGIIYMCIKCSLNVGKM